MSWRSWAQGSLAWGGSTGPVIHSAALGVTDALGTAEHVVAGGLVCQPPARAGLPPFWAARDQGGVTRRPVVNGTETSGAARAHRSARSARPPGLAARGLRVARAHRWPQVGAQHGAHRRPSCRSPVPAPDLPAPSALPSCVS